MLMAYKPMLNTMSFANKNGEYHGKKRLNGIIVYLKV